MLSPQALATPPSHYTHIRACLSMDRFLSTSGRRGLVSECLSWKVVTSASAPPMGCPFLNGKSSHPWLRAQERISRTQETARKQAELVHSAAFVRMQILPLSFAKIREIMPVVSPSPSSRGEHHPFLSPEVYIPNMHCTAGSQAWLHITAVWGALTTTKKCLACAPQRFWCNRSRLGPWHGN